MANIFNSVFMPKVGSNTFDMSYDMKLSLDMGDLTPIHTQEIVPGDKITISTESLLRFAPLIAPVMHKVDVYTHFFFVPNRILWSGWEAFITAQPSAPAFPYLANIGTSAGSLADYLGLPIVANIDKVSALPFAAYQRIYNEYYRDQNLVTEVAGTNLNDGLNNTFLSDLTTMRKRAWQHDYFTAALPFAQKGAAVNIPLGDVKLKTGWAALPGDPNFKASNGVQQTGAVSGTPSTITIGGITQAYDPAGTLETTPTTVNDLRRAIKLQEWAEKQARGGTRYVESLLSHFGVKSSDARLQRPEYLGGNKQPMVISEVLQTSKTDTSPQGNLAGHGISVGGGKAFTYRAEEHGYIIGIMSVMPKTAYQQGIPKHFSKFDYLDFYWPSFADLGEQEVKGRELYYENGNVSYNDGTFGYVPRYSEYRYHDSRVAGDFRASLSYWHLGRIFSGPPALNGNFITSDPSKRIFAVSSPTIDSIYAHVFHKIKAVRKMPKYANPDF